MFAASSTSPPVLHTSLVLTDFSGEPFRDAEGNVVEPKIELKMGWHKALQGPLQEPHSVSVEMGTAELLKKIYAGVMMYVPCWRGRRGNGTRRREKQEGWDERGWVVMS